MLSIPLQGPTLSAEGGSYSIYVSCYPDPWSIVAKPSWVSLSQYSGVNGSSITLTANMNTGTDFRAGNIVLMCGKKTQTHMISQYGGDYLLLSLKSWTGIPSAGGSKRITVSSNKHWTAIVDQPWIVLSGLSDIYSNDSMTITVMPNEEPYSRSGTVCFYSAGKVMAALTVVQNAGDMMVISAEQWNLYASGYTDSITVNSSGPWTASANQRWITLSDTYGAGAQSVVITVSPYTGTAYQREGILSFKCGQKTATLTIRQVNYDYFTVSHSLWENVTALGDHQQITMDCSGAWTASADQSWIHLSRSFGSHSNGIMSTNVIVDKNTSEVSRTGVVTFTYGAFNRSRTLTITQNGVLPIPMPVASIALSDTLWTGVIASGGSKSLSVFSEAEWLTTKSASASWVSLSQDSGVGSQEILITVEANSSKDKRHAMLLFTCGSKTEVLLIEQNGADNVTSISAASWTAIKAGGHKAVTVKGGSWTASVFPKFTSITHPSQWITLSSVSGRDDETMVVTISPNPMMATRRGYVLFMVDHQPKRLVITQNGSDSISVTPVAWNDIIFNDRPIYRTVDIACNADWVAEHNADWIALSHTKGSGNQKIRLTVYPNASREQREAIVTFTCGSEMEQMTVRQGGAAKPE
jgi:hypothetical protein